MLKSNSKTVVIAACASLITLLTGCASNQELVRIDNVTLENVDSSSVRITRTYLHSMEDAVTLRGELTRRISARGPIPGHVHVELIDFDGKVIKEAEVGYKRKNVKSRYAYFSLPIPDLVASGNTIRVTHHDMRSHFSESSDSPWRDVETNKQL